jgi:hypothetical protein
MLRMIGVSPRFGHADSDGDDALARLRAALTEYDKLKGDTDGRN